MIIDFILKAAFDYLLSNPLDPLDKMRFNEHCGVGVVVTPDQIKSTVNIGFQYHLIDKKIKIIDYNFIKVQELLKTHHAELVEKRYRFNLGLLMAELRNKLKWADGKLVKNEMDSQVFFFL
jgi:glutaminyl-tRNA synthetase